MSHLLLAPPLAPVHVGGGLSHTPPPRLPWSLCMQGGYMELAGLLSKLLMGHLAPNSTGAGPPRAPGNMSRVT